MNVRVPNRPTRSCTVMRVPAAGGTCRSLKRGELTNALNALRAAMEADDLKAIHAVLTRSVEGYRHDTQQPLPEQTLNGSAATLAGRSAS